MNAAGWKRKIRAACRDAGTYRPYFESVISILAGIMELRDTAAAKFLESGSEIVVERTNKSGAVNTVKNPALVAILDCNAQALQYWKELGLTPAGLKRLNDAAMKEPENKDTFASVLERLGV